MDNYKIKVKDEAESKEAQELFFELGFHWKWSNKREFLRESISYLFTQVKDIYYGVSLTEFDKCEGQELTLVELRVLATPKIKKDQGLISGAEALRALADGKNVQVSTEHSRSTWDNDTATYSAEEILAEEAAETDDYCSMKLFFRLKPATLTVNAELPKPSNTTLHNQNYSVTYEFGSREDRNAFVEGLGGNNS